LEDASLEMKMMGQAATETTPPFAKESIRESAPKNMQGLFTYVNPFEQLAASSPRNRTPKNSTPGPSSSPAIQILKHPRHDTSDQKRQTDERSAVSSPAHSKRKLDPSQASPSSPIPLPDGRTPVEALMGIGASDHKETVQDALNVVGSQVDREVQDAIARAENDENQAEIEKDLQDMLEAKTEEEFEVAAQAAAIAIKKELEKEENLGALDSLPSPVAEAVKDIIDDTAHGHIADSWESADAEDSPIKDEEESVIKVYNFPMRPWTSFTIKETEETRPLFRDDAVMDIARLKKDFDQIDRTLVTASNNFIVYGMSKNGGVRIIRQDDGKDARLFTETHDRIFSVVTSSSSVDLKEGIIGTGISGTVYWALIKDGEGDHIEESNPEQYGFALPPIQALDSESPGGVLKTRARKSSNHPDFFAVGRGKFIHVIWPSVILKQSFLKNGKDRIVDVEKYLAKHSLKVNTGKAGKDFTFSEDDTTIVSLDKAGRVKFWDVRSLTKTDIIGNPTHAHSVEIKEPLITFTTTPATEKSWPTSVLLVDKLRPYQRGGALRYLIVGMKQNHTLQLWDLALGKPVQEIHLPHSKESDAVCSVLYHASSSMIIVGHPTRNSIYFLHLSAPKYNLPKNVTQAEYIEKLVAGDPSAPKPESTAVISGMREYSFANKGVLRSLDILQSPNSASASADSSTLFELYAMHSKGVTCLNIKQADLGWNSDNKVVNPVSAEKVGVISIDTLKEITATPAPEATETAAQPLIPTRIVARPATKESVAKETPRKTAQNDASSIVPKSDDKAEKKEVSPSNGGLASASGPEKSEKKKRRKATSENSIAGPSSAPQPSQSKMVVLDPSSNTRNGNVGKSNAGVVSVPESTAVIPSQDISDAAIKSIETRVAAEVKTIFGQSMDSLYQNIKDDRRTQAAVAEAKSDAMLRLVSSTLSDNIEVTLGRIVSGSIQKSVLPALSDLVDEQFGTKLNSHLIQNMPMELQKVLPDAIGKALQQPQLLKLMSESLAKSVAFRVEEQFAIILQNVVTPAFTSLAIQTSQRVAGDIQRQAASQIENFERQRQADTVKIDQLTQLVTSLTETVSSMASAQSDFQGQFLRMQQQAIIDRRQAAARQSEGQRSSISRPSSSALAAPVEKSPAEEEYDSMLKSIGTAMAEGEYENAVIQWLQTQREQEFFKKYFCQYNPDFIRELSPLLLLSLGATVSLEFEDSFIHQRIAWMEVIVNSFQSHYIAGTLVRKINSIIVKDQLSNCRLGATSQRTHPKDHGHLHSTYRAPFHAHQPNCRS
jgi:WD40 repeat protein